MRVLMTNIIALCDEGLYEELLRYVPTERQEKIARCGKRTYVFRARTIYHACL